MAGFRLVGSFWIFLLFAYPFEAFSELTQPSWSELNSYQKTILQPLEQNWDMIEPAQKKKWLRITKYYLKKTPEEQQRIQFQMRSWSAMTPQQRKQARERYKKIEKIPADKRQEVKKKLRKPDEMPANSNSQK